MPDVAIVNQTVTGVPDAYTVPGSTGIVIKAVRATIDGTGAAGAFLPALQLLDSAGHVMWTAVDTSSTVAAGGSADVSWFPGVKGKASSGGGGSVTMAYCKVVQPSWTWPQPGNTFVDWAGSTVSISDTTVFTNNIATDSTTPIKIIATGIYLMWGGIGPWRAAWGTNAILANMGADFGSWDSMGDTSTNFPLTYEPTLGNGNTLVTVTKAIYPTVPVGGGSARMEVNQTSGANRTVGAAMTILRLTANGNGV